MDSMTQRALEKIARRLGWLIAWQFIWLAILFLL